MRAAALLSLVLAGAALAQSPAPPRIGRALLEPVEHNFDNRLRKFNLDHPFFLLGTTRGVYIAGFGAVFTAEVDLVAGSQITPFRPAFSKEEIAQLRTTKLERLPKLKQVMREMLAGSAASLDPVPESENLVLGILLVYREFEDRTGLPAQILMRATRRALLDARKNGATLANAIQVQEF